MKHYVYKITNNVNGKIYVGVHSTTDFNDGYMGSGKYIKMAIAKYGAHNFTKEQLFEFDQAEDAYLMERELVDHDFIKRSDTYNCDIGGSGGKNWTPELRKKMSEVQKKRFASGDSVWNKGKIMTPEILESMSKRMKGKLSGEKNPMYGVRVRDLMTEEQRIAHSQNISKANKGKVRTDEHKKNYSETAKLRKWLVNKDGVVCSTIDPNDPRLSDPNWQRGRKWKQ